MASRHCPAHKRFVRTCDKCVKKVATSRRASDRAHAKRLAENYGITPEEYQAMLDAQDGRCYICRRLPGAKRLAVDHDHEIEKRLLEAGWEFRAARRASLRGLLCRNANFHVVGGEMRNDPEAFLRGYEYLTDPPGRRVLGVFDPLP